MYIDIWDCYIFLLGWFFDHYLVSFLISCNPLYFKVCFGWYEDCYYSFFFVSHLHGIYFFHPLTFSLYVSLGLKCASCRQLIYGSCFCIHLVSLCLLVGAFNSFTLLTFKVIIDTYVPITIFLTVWGWFCRSFFLSFFFCIYWLDKSL